jgi:hypothetical protein
MTDADLTALWSAWLRDKAQIHKMIHLTSAMFRAHAEAVAAAARRSPPGRVEAWEDSRGRGSFAGLVRGPDGSLEPCGGVTHGYAPDAMPKGLKQACDARFTVYGSAGPYRPTSPEDDGDGA